MRDQVITSFFLLNEKSKEKMINFLKTNDMFIYLRRYMVGKTM